MAKNKVLWVVNYDDLTDFVSRAKAVGATAVAIRTDNDVGKAIGAFHAEGIKVFGWRWPSAKADAAMKEANKAASLLGEGMDGYFVDPEGADPSKPYNWDSTGLAPLADQFCSTIRAAGRSKPFGVTSHYLAKAIFPKLPWASFFKHATVLLPQSYWRSTDGVIGHGIPEDNYARGIEFWMKAGGDKANIQPMAGELAVSTAKEVAAYAVAAAERGVDTLHFYTYEEAIKPAVWAAVAAT